MKCGVWYWYSRYHKVFTSWDGWCWVDGNQKIKSQKITLWKTSSLPITHSFPIHPPTSNPSYFFHDDVIWTESIKVILSPLLLLTPKRKTCKFYRPTNHTKLHNINVSSKVITMHWWIGSIPCSVQLSMFFLFQKKNDYTYKVHLILYFHFIHNILNKDIYRYTDNIVNDDYFTKIIGVI